MFGGEKEGVIIQMLTKIVANIKKYLIKFKIKLALEIELSNINEKKND